jgi:hypothetical protein
MNNLHIVTVATESKYYFPYLVESCKRNGSTLVVLGYGDEWKGFNYRFKLMIDYLKKLPPNDIVCFVDGYDVLCVRDLNELSSEFIKIKNKTNCKIIVAKDTMTNSVFSYIGALIFDQCKNTNINAGTYIGYASELLNIVETIYQNNPDNSNDDQILLTQYCKNNENIFHIDEKNELFFTQLTFLDEIDKYLTINNKDVFVNNENPFFIHAPSGFFDNLIIKLGYGYDYDNKIKNVLSIELFTIKIWKGVFKNYIILFIIFIILLLIYYILFKTVYGKKILKMLN